MKKTIIVLLALALLLSFAPPFDTAFADAAFVPGEYSATVASVGGPMTVKVTVIADRIESVEVVENHDTDGVRDAAIERIPAAIVENQSVNVDAVTGATLTSIFLKNAVLQALDQAGDTSAFKEAVPYLADPQQDMEVDVVIAGGGIAGMSALASACVNGLSAVLVERNGLVGGDALVSDQLATYFGSVDPTMSSWGEMIAEYQANGIGLDTVDFWGLENALISVPEKGTSSTIHALMNYITAVAEKSGAKILLETTATGLLVEEGKVVGVKAQPKGQDEFSIRAKAVVLATGGFANNAELVSKYYPYASGARYVGMPGAKGDALEWVKEVDADLVGMDAEKASFYSVNKNTGYMAEFGTVGIHFISMDGELITDNTNYNTGTLDVYKAIGSEPYYTVSEEGEIIAAGCLEDYEHMITSGSVKVYQGIEAMIGELGTEKIGEVLISLGYTEDSVFYVGNAVAGIYGTYGGLNTDNEARVLNTSGEVIPGLYACGEVIGSRAYQQTGAYDGGLGNGLTWGYITGKTIMADLAA